MEVVERELIGVRNNQIANLLNYLNTGQFTQSNASYIKASAKVIDLAGDDYNCEHLYQYFKAIIVAYTDTVVKPDLLNKSGVELIHSLSKRWVNHKILIFYLRQMFQYLDRYYIPNKKLEPLFLAGVTTFKLSLFDNIKHLVKKAILDQILEERNGSPTDHGVVKECLAAFVQMGSTSFSISKVAADGGDKLVWTGSTELQLYKEEFEAVFLVETFSYYQEKSSGWINSLQCTEYLKEAARAFYEEEKRLENYLDRSTEPELIKILVKLLVTNHAKTLCDMPTSGCAEMFKNKKYQELHLLYSLCKKDESTFVHIKDQLTLYIETKGSSIVNDAKLQEDAIEFTKKILEFKEEADIIVEKYFESCIYFQRCRDTAFQSFLNKNPYSAQFIASYADYEMKKGLKGLSDSEIDKKLNAIVKLFICLHDRDVFIRFYTRYLSKRLLQETSVNSDAENSLISKLKIECGHSLISKISNMYQDKSLSETLQREFMSLSHKGSPDGVSMNVQVLRSGCWPEQNSEVCILPAELMSCFGKYQQFYLNKHSGRNLCILNGFGTIELGTLFCARTYICLVNSLQASVILLFNKSDSYRFDQIQDLTKISENTLKSILLPFFNPKFKLLSKQSPAKIIKADELIELNLKFNNTSLRVNFIPKKVKKLETNTTEDDKAIENERKYILDSVIVRIAKGRKTIRHNDLISEVIRQVTHFRPQPAMIKGQIESLMQREFLKRDDDDKSLYIYLP